MFMVPICTENTKLLLIQGSMLLHCHYLRYREPVSEDNAMKVPHVTSGVRNILLHSLHLFSLGVVYAYLVSGAGRSTGEGTFRALTRGFIHWQSGCLEKLEINVHHPHFCHVQSQTKPSLRQGTYHVSVLLGHDNNYASALSATCQRTAGQVSF